ncbi:MAG: RNA methyltransferase, partial [bacterium]
FNTLRNLSRRKEREETRSFIVEGERAVFELYDKTLPNYSLEYIIVSSKYLDKVDAGKFKKASVYRLDDKSFEQIADTQTPQGIAAVVKYKSLVLADIKNIKSDALFVVCDGVSDPGNLGTVIRAADAANADGVIIAPGTVDPYNSKAIRAAMGSLFHVNIYFCNDRAELVKKLKSENVKILVADRKAKRSYWEADMGGKLALVLGSEAHGVSDDMRSLAIDKIGIPIYGNAESLNVAMAGTLLLYEAQRQRQGAKCC